jgi:uncharacterized YccA/Bax inhibitor family protein
MHKEDIPGAISALARPFALTSMMLASVDGVMSTLIAKDLLTAAGHGSSTPLIAVPAVMLGIGQALGQGLYGHFGAKVGLRKLLTRGGAFMFLCAIFAAGTVLIGSFWGYCAAKLVLAIPFGLLFIITPFIAMLIKKTIPVTGTLYCFSVGYCVSLMAQLFAEYRDPISLALIITVAIVAVMALVYAKGWIKVGDKFRSIMRILFFASIASSLLMLVACFVPQLRGMVMFVVENPLLSIGGSVAYVVIAALFLLVDFDTIQTAVEGQLPRKYEWIAAFGLAFSVIWLFLKVLELILKLTGKSSSDN